MDLAAIPDQPETAVEPVAVRERIVEVKRDQDGRDVAGEVLDDYADLEHLLMTRLLGQPAR